MRSFVKKIKLMLVITLLSTTVDAQLPADVSNTTNYGSASWGVGTGSNAFNVSGPYDATSNLATDVFYDSNSPSGTAIEISGNTAPAFYNLIFDNGADASAAITNTAGIDVEGSLQLLNGITSTINDVAGAIRLGNTATTAGSSSFSATRYIDGYVGKTGNTTFSFPLGNAGIYSPVSFSNPSGTTLRYTVGNIGTMDSKDNSQGTLNLATVSGLEYYPITSAAPSGSTITMPYGNFENGYVTDPSSLTIAGWDGSQWVNLGSLSNTINTIDKTVTITLNQDLTGFTQIALGSTSVLNPLPVEMVSFTGVSIDCIIQLNWTTSMELNSHHYDIEVSADGIRFTKTGTVVSHNLPNGSSYRFTFHAAKSSTYYFRLKMIDIDGYISYSKIIRAVNNCNKDRSIVIAPNPVQKTVSIYGLTGKVSVAILDGTGKRIIQQQNFGDVSMSIPVGHLRQGIYVVRIVQENGRVTTAKIIKQ